MQELFWRILRFFAALTEKHREEKKSISELLLKMHINRQIKLSQADKHDLFAKKHLHFWKSSAIFEVRKRLSSEGKTQWLR